jgi:hypothetical protein
MVVSENAEMLVPGLVGVGRGGEDRKQVDERLAPSPTELAPQRNRPAGNEFDRLVVGHCVLDEADQDPGLKSNYSLSLEAD